MRLMRFESDNYDVTDEVHLKSKTDYVITRGLIGHYARACDGFMQLQDYKTKSFAADIDWNGKRILIHRLGGAGDLLFATPLLRELKKRWPKCHIAFHCEKKYHWVFAGNPHIDECLAPPLLKDFVEKFDGNIDLEDAIEFSPLAKTHLAVDVFASVAGIELSDKKTIYEAPPPVIQIMRARFPKVTKRIGISLLSNSIIRNYPYSLFLEVIRLLMENNLQVILLGNEMTGVKNRDLFIDLAAEKPPLSWQESIAFLYTCDVVLGNDSSAIHFAGAMGIPSLGLYGSFPAALRIPSQPATQAIQATGICAPCFHNGRKNVRFPAQGLCNQTGRCEVLASISPQQIVIKIFEMLSQSQQGAQKIDAVIPKDQLPRVLFVTPTTNLPT